MDDEYIGCDKKRLARLTKEAQQFQDDIVCAVGTDFMQKIAEAENRMIFDILKWFTADVVEARHGVWIKTSYPEVHRCSACDTPSNTSKGLHNYCPNCGVKMDGQVK